MHGLCKDAEIACQLLLERLIDDRYAHGITQRAEVGDLCRYRIQLL